MPVSICKSGAPRPLRKTDFDISVQHVAAFQLDHLADTQPNGDDIRVAVSVELHDGVRAKVLSVLEIVVQDRLHRDQLRAGSRQCVLIRCQHSSNTPTQPRLEDPAAPPWVLSGPKLLLVAVGTARRGPVPTVSV
jgi:hypothetical protein